MIIDHHQLTSEALDNIIDTYVTTELASCNEQDSLNLPHLRQQVRSKLDLGECYLEYSLEKETVWIKDRSLIK